MKPLLPLDSPKYLRRLVRALNAHVRSGRSFYCITDTAWRCNGFNANLSKCHWAKFVGGGILVDLVSTGGGQTMAKLGTFQDENGRSIVASRQA